MSGKGRHAYSLGDVLEGFQIWINVPSHKKMDDPQYGTSSEPLAELVVSSGVRLRVVAGTKGLYQTAIPVQMIDVILEAGSSYAHSIDPLDLDNLYKGAGTLSGNNISMHDVACIDATSALAWSITT